MRIQQNRRSLVRLFGYRSEVFMNTNYSIILVSFFTFFVFSVNIFGQYSNLQFKNSPSAVKGPDAASRTMYPNPILMNEDHGCDAENLNPERFSSAIKPNQRVAFCEALEEVSAKLSDNWSPGLRSEIREIWQVFLRENVKIRPMKEGVSPRVAAAAESFTENGPGGGFNASFYLRPERATDKSFFPVFMHELRHIFDFYTLWKSQTRITEAELEKRGFRIMGRIYQEITEKPQDLGIPSFWENSWKDLSSSEIDRRREEKIEDFMRRSSFYKDLLKSPENHPVGFTDGSASIENGGFNPIEEVADESEKLPTRVNIGQTGSLVPQQVKQLTFSTENAVNQQNPQELLQAALLNEKNLYHKMDNFIYEQRLELQCWKKQQVIDTYELSGTVARTDTGEALFQKQTASSASPKCILDINAIRTDATETFWAAPYLDQMPIKFETFTEIDGIRVARYTVLAPSREKFNQIAAQYPKIFPFRTFVGTIFVSTRDSQIIKFWGTSFPESETTGNQATRTYASYCATAIRQKLASGIWVTTALNTVAVTNDKNKMKPFSYLVKYQNYRQGDSEVKILDDDQSARK